MISKKSPFTQRGIFFKLGASLLAGVIGGAAALAGGLLAAATLSYAMIPAVVAFSVMAIAHYSVLSMSDDKSSHTMSDDCDDFFGDGQRLVELGHNQFQFVPIHAHKLATVKRRTKNTETANITDKNPIESSERKSQRRRECLSKQPDNYHERYLRCLNHARSTKQELPEVPQEFFCSLSKKIMSEPVRKSNSSEVYDLGVLQRQNCSHKSTGRNSHFLHITRDFDLKKRIVIFIENLEAKIAEADFKLKF